MEGYDLYIRGARVIDSETNTDHILNVAVKGAVIAYRDPEEPPAQSLDGAEIIDGKGLILSAGFIDLHTHEDHHEKSVDGFNLPREIASCAARSGVTTILGGNCGGSNYPVGAYLDTLKQAGLPINCLTQIGAGTLRATLGIDRYRAASPLQIARMKDLALAAFDEGATGISFGLQYMPGTSFAEVCALASAAAERDKFFSVHLRFDYPSKALEGLDEAIAAAEISGAALQVSHIAANIYGHTPEGADNLTLAAERIVASPADISADMYPYDTWATGIKAAFLDEGLDNYNFKERDVEIISGPYAGQYCTKELYQQLRHAEEDTSIACHNATPKDAIEAAYKLPFVSVGSDAVMSIGPRGEKKGHPRTAGSPAKFLKEFVRERKVLPLPQAVRKLTLLPALRLSLKKKGRIQVGCDADLILFDINRITDKSSYGVDTCALPPEGIVRTIVVGKVL